MPAGGHDWFVHRVEADVATEANVRGVLLLLLMMHPAAVDHVGSLRAVVVVVAAIASGFDRSSGSGSDGGFQCPSIQIAFGTDRCRHLVVVIYSVDAACWLVVLLVVLLALTLTVYWSGLKF